MYYHVTEDELLHKINIAVCAQIVIELINANKIHWFPSLVFFFESLFYRSDPIMLFCIVRLLQRNLLTWIHLQNVTIDLLH